MKRYMVFAGYDFYPSGGMNDFIDSFNSLDDAIDEYLIKVKGEGFNWCHVFDNDTMKLVVST